MIIKINFRQGTPKWQRVLLYATLTPLLLPIAVTAWVLLLPLRGYLWLRTRKRTT